MLTVTKNAIDLLKAAKAARGRGDETAIRIHKGVASAQSEGLAIGLAFSRAPYPADQELEQEGLRIFVEEALVEPLRSRTLDVREESDGFKIVLC